MIQNPPGCLIRPTIQCEKKIFGGQKKSGIPYFQLLFNPLVPSVHFLDVFPVFLSKRRCSSQRIFSMKPSKSPLSIFLSTGANLKIIEKKADL